VGNLEVPKGATRAEEILVGDLPEVTLLLLSSLEILALRPNSTILRNSSQKLDPLKL